MTTEQQNELNELLATYQKPIDELIEQFNELKDEPTTFHVQLRRDTYMKSIDLYRTTKKLMIDKWLKERELYNVIKKGSYIMC